MRDRGFEVHGNHRPREVHVVDVLMERLVGAHDVLERGAFDDEIVPMASVIVSPVSFATCRANRSVSGSRMLIGIVLLSIQDALLYG